MNVFAVAISYSFWDDDVDNDDNFELKISKLPKKESDRPTKQKVLPKAAVT